MSSSSETPVYRTATRVVNVESNPADPYNPASTPIYQTATFKQTSAVSSGDYDYSRSGNPTRTQTEKHLGNLMSAHRALCVTSGMTALDVIMRILNSGDEVIAGVDLYGGTNRLLKFLEKAKINTVHVDTCLVGNVTSAITARTKMILLETPTNPLIGVCDIRAICEIAHSRNQDIVVVVDNTMMSPMLQRPLELGADIVYHSGTKYLSGHHDLMAGVIGVANEALGDQLYFVINSTGVGLAPFESWLLMRGVKTLAVRMEKQQASAMRIADYLEKAGLKVNYPGLKSHPSYILHHKQAIGGGAVLSFETGSTMVSQQIVEGCKLFAISVSFGCVNSLISMPCRMSHASIPPEVRKERNLAEDVIRLCVGIEDADDLIEDLEQSLKAANVV
eukprot:CFRG1176T1